jgi:hypothetical protein
MPRSGADLLLSKTTASTQRRLLLDGHEPRFHHVSFMILASILL